jgi:hypothetical protein
MLMVPHNGVLNGTGKGLSVTQGRESALLCCTLAALI